MQKILIVLATAFTISSSFAEDVYLSFGESTSIGSTQIHCGGSEPSRAPYYVSCSCMGGSTNSYDLMVETTGSYRAYNTYPNQTACLDALSGLRAQNMCP